MIISGRKTKQIENEIRVSIDTISTRRVKIIGKMGLDNSAELIH